MCTVKDLDLFGGCFVMEEPHTERWGSLTRGSVMDHVLKANV